MLSYRHAFHAGNHADVLKHLVLATSLTLMKRKDKPVLYADTHAGAGLYSLTDGYAAQNNEWAGGIEKVRSFSVAGVVPEAVTRYLAAVDAACDRQLPGAYPGSPLIASTLLTVGDRLVLFELHPADHAALHTLFAAPGPVSGAGGAPVAEVRQTDGFAGLRSVLPPPLRRGLVLVDPSYELASDYEALVSALSDALGRFATGVYLVWYPILERPEAAILPDTLRSLSPRWLDVRLRVRGNLPGERGMHGSGVFVINPPWQLRESMEEALPWLADAVGGEGRGWSAESEGE